MTELYECTEWNRKQKKKTSLQFVKWIIFAEQGMSVWLVLKAVMCAAGRCFICSSIVCCNLYLCVSRYRGSVGGYVEGFPQQGVSSVAGQPGCCPILPLHHESDKENRQLPEIWKTLKISANNFFTIGLMDGQGHSLLVLLFSFTFHMWGVSHAVIREISEGSTATPYFWWKTPLPLLWHSTHHFSVW